MQGGASVLRGRWRYLLFALAVTAQMMSAIDNTIVAVGVPSLITQLQTTLVWVGWVFTMYQLAQTIALPTMGRLSDVLGRKRVFLTCIGLFLFGSLCCSLAPNVYLLIFGRLIQGVGGGGLLPSTAGIISDQFPERRTQMIALITSTVPVGGVIGPTVGGLILAHLSWRALFYVNLPIGLVVLVVCARLLPREPPRSNRSIRIDWSGIGLYALGIVSLMSGLTVLGSGDIDANLGLLVPLGVVAGVLLGLFIRHETRAPAPLIELQLLREKVFALSNTYNFVYGALVLGSLSLVPYYTTLVYHFDAVQSGAVLTPRSIMMIASSTAASFYLTRVGYRLPLFVGMLVAGAGLLVLGQAWSHLDVFGVSISDFVWLATIIGVMGIALGVMAPASNNVALDLMPERTAAITGLRGMFRQTGGMFGLAIATAFVNHQSDHGQGLRTVYTLGAFVLFVTAVMATQIPDTIRTRSRAGANVPRPTEPAELVTEGA